MNNYTFSNNNLLSLKAKIVLFRHSKFFSILTTSIIIIYSLILGYETYYKKIPLILQVLDYSITIFFVIEIAIKIYSERRKLDFFKDKWNTFDFIVITASLIPLNAFNSLAVARILRIFRVLRLITINEGVKKLLIALEGAIPSIINVVLIMFVVFYVYAILGTNFFAQINPDLWGNVSVSLLTLFRVMTFEDWTDVMYETMAVYPVSWVYFISFIIINAFVFFNLFVAVIVNEMSKINENDIKTSLENEKREIYMIMKELKKLDKKFDELQKRIK